KAIYPPSSPNQTFTASECVGVIGKAEDFRQGDPTNLPASQLSGATASATTKAKMEDGGWKMAQGQPSASAPSSILHPPSSPSPSPSSILHPPSSPSSLPLYALILPDPNDLSLHPATTRATTQPLNITITAVQGLASVRPDESSAWQPAQVGMTFGTVAEFRTGPRGSIQFKIPPDQTITVDRLTTLKVLQVIQKGGKI